MDAVSPPLNIDRNKRPRGEDGREPGPTHMAYAVHRSPQRPPEWVTLGPITRLENGHIMGRFTSIPTSAWGHEWLAVPIGEEPPPLSAEPPAKKPARQSRHEPGKRAPEPEPLPGEDDEPRGMFSGGDDDR